MPRAPGLLALVAATPLCLGCPWLFPEPEPSTAPAQDCYREPPGDTSTLAPRSVELGRLAGDAFAPYEDGELVELVVGFQGAAMITPYLELPAQAGDGERACWWVEIDYLDGNYAVAGSRSGFVFEPVGDRMRAGPLFELPEELYGRTVAVTATVVGDDFIAVDEVVVELGDY